MNIKTTCALIAASIILCTSCSIEKRHYRNGFYVDNIIDHRTPPNKINEGSDTTAINSVINGEKTKKDGGMINSPISSIPDPNRSKDEAQIQAASPTAIEQADTDEAITNVGKSNITVMAISESTAIMKPINPEPTKDKDGETGINNFAFLAFIFGILALFTTIYGAIIFGLAAVICGIIAFGQIRKDPEHQKGKALAWIGYICGLLGVTIWLLIG